MALLEITDLKKTYGRRKAVDGISFNVDEGEIYGILGPNGAGKSTTLSMICGLITPQGGSIKVGGFDISKDPVKAKRLIGVVPQETALYPMLSAKENLRFFGTINGINASKINEAVSKALMIVGLENRANGRISKFSGGMKRRLNIAAGLIHEPKLLIMDEPTVGIDPQSRNHILNTVKELKKGGMTVIYTSHYVEEVEYLCDRITVMDHGRIISEGTLIELMKKESEFQKLTINCGRVPNECNDIIKQLPFVEEVVSFSDYIDIITSNAEKILPVAFIEIIKRGGSVSEIKIQKPDLESLFLKLTGRTLRNGEV